MFDRPIVRKPATVLADAPSNGEKLPVQLVVPHVRDVQPNDPVPVTVVTSIAGVAKLPIAGALSFEDDELLALVVANPRVFGIQCVGLLGYPEAEYTPEWEKLMWSTDKVAYAELVTEIVASERLDAAMKDQAGSRQKPERRQQELTRERKRHFSGAAMWDPTGKASEPIAISEDDDAADHGA